MLLGPDPVTPVNVLNGVLISDALCKRQSRACGMRSLRLSFGTKEGQQRSTYADRQQQKQVNSGSNKVRSNLGINLFFHKSGFVIGAVSVFGISYGRGAGVGRGLGVGAVLGIGVALGVAVTVGVVVTDVLAVAVALAVTVAVAVAVTVAVGVGVGGACAQYFPPVLR